MDTKGKQWKLNPLVKQSSETLYVRQNEVRGMKDVDK